MAPLLPLLRGPLGWIGCWDMALPFPQPENTHFFYSPSAGGLQVPHDHAMKLGHFLWAWGLARVGKAGHLCHTCEFMSVMWPCTPSVGQAGMCAWGWPHESESCGFVFMPGGLGAVYLCEHVATGHRCACVCAHVVRGWLQAQACGFCVHRAGPSTVSHAWPLQR